MKMVEQLRFILLLRVVNWQYLSTYFKELQSNVLKLMMESHHNIWLLKMDILRYACWSSLIGEERFRDFLRCLITNPHMTNNNLKDPTRKTPTPFHWAAENGVLNICHPNYITITKRHEIVNLIDENSGTTPLHLAAESGQLAIFDYTFQRIAVKCP